MSFREFLVVAVGVTLPCQAQGQQPSPIARALPNGVQVTRDIEYAAYGERTLRLDLFAPEEPRSSRLPAVVAIRGGGWRIGDKEGFGPVAAALAERGLVAVSIEYRTSGEAVFPAAVHDTKAAVRWLRRNATEFGVDTGAIGVIGGSAGAHLATYLGLTSHLVNLEGFGGHQGASSAVSAVVGLATPARFSGDEEPVIAFLGTTHEADANLWELASPVTHVNASSPPLLLIHSEADPVVSFTQSLGLARRYGASNVPVEVVLIPDAPHAFWNFQEWFGETMDRSAAFFWRYLAHSQ